MSPSGPKLVQPTDVPSRKINEHPTHPLSPLTATEISEFSEIVRRYVAEKMPNTKAFKFIGMLLVEPKKADVLSVLGIPTTYGQKVEPSSKVLPREAEVLIIDLVSGTAYKILAFLSSGVSSCEQLPDTVQPGISPEELITAEALMRTYPQIIRLCEEVGVKPEELWADGWSIGYDERFGSTRRVQQCLMYARFEKDANLYAHPLDFMPVLDNNTFELLHIDFPTHRFSGKEFPSTKPPSLQDDAQHGRERLAPPRGNGDYLPDLSGLAMRTDLKPLNITQPEGVSFSMNGNELEWQKWKMHIGYHPREGLVISTVTYKDKGEVRPVIYRLSVAEMVVPYADPAHPHPRKHAFDVGEYNMGTVANELSLGCDCKGSIHYLPGAYVSHSGAPVEIKNVVCIHEEDAGLLFKHSDYRPGGRAYSVRSRRLVVSCICTVANYEYCYYFNFYLDGTIELEIRLTGILNIYRMAEGEEIGGHTTVVAPELSAQYHQHLFSIRIDPMIDGTNNTVTETDVIPSPHKTGSDQNFGGNAFISTKKILKSTSEGARDYDLMKARKWTVTNPDHLHYASKQPVGYAIATKDFAPLLAQPDSWVAKRATFTQHSLFVTPYQQDQIYPAGYYVPQTSEAPKDSILNWMEGDKNIENTDVVLYLTAGLTHVPRPEDWPIMPVEHLRVALKPIGFFDSNPALDVPSATDASSVHAFGTGAQRTDGNTPQAAQVTNANGHTHTANGFTGANGAADANGCCSSSNRGSSAA